MRGCSDNAYTSRSLARTIKGDARVRARVTLVVALALVGLVATFGCQGEGAQGGRTSGSSGVTIQVGDGVVDIAPSQGTATGETTALTARERFSEENLRKVDEFVAQQMDQEKLPSVAVGAWAPGEGQYLTAQGKGHLDTGEQPGRGNPSASLPLPRPSPQRRPCSS